MQESKDNFIEVFCQSKDLNNISPDMKSSL